MAKSKIIRSILFFAVGIVIFWWVFRDTDFETLMKEFRKVKWEWIGISLFVNLFTVMIRAVRWRLLFIPMNYKPSLFNLFLGNIIMAFTNQVIPRGGEIARLSVVNKTDNIPFAKLVGTALAERLTDLIVLFTLFGVIIAWQFKYFKQILNLPAIQTNSFNTTKILLFGGGIILALILAWIIFIKTGLLNKFRDKIRKFKMEVSEGFKSFARIPNKGFYIVISFSYYIIGFFMFYVLFFALPSTSDLSFGAAVFTFGLATTAFLLPIQSGLGAWHFIVIQSLLLFGIDSETGKTFSLISHAATNLVNLPLGGIAFLILFIRARNRRMK